MKKKIRKVVKKSSKSKKVVKKAKVVLKKKKSVSKKKVAPKKKIVAKKKKVVSKKAKVVKIKAEKPVGVVTHYYNKIKVAVVKFKEPVKVGEKVLFKGATTNFSQVVASLQYEHEQIKVSKKGQSLGLKVAKRVREGDEIFIEK